MDGRMGADCGEVLIFVEFWRRGGYLPASCKQTTESGGKQTTTHENMVIHVKTSFK